MKKDPFPILSSPFETTQPPASACSRAGLARKRYILAQVHFFFHENIKPEDHFKRAPTLFWQRIFRRWRKGPLKKLPAPKQLLRKTSLGGLSAPDFSISRFARP
jgi:hypothetical protein